MSLKWRILITIILAVIFWGITGCTSPEQGKVSDHKPTVAALRTEFEEANLKYFYGSIPRNTEIVLGDLTAEEYMGLTTQRSDGSFLITIDTKTHPLEKEAELTLLHELCHVDDKVAGASEGWDGHSDAFQACMQHLAANGALKDLW
jgi:hypothetical protein